jgi:hypothetical protein
MTIFAGCNPARILNGVDDRQSMFLTAPDMPEKSHGELRDQGASRDESQPGFVSTIGH